MDADGGEVRPESVFELARRVDPRLLGHRQLGDGGEAAIRRWQTHEVG